MRSKADETLVSRKKNVFSTLLLPSNVIVTTRIGLLDFVYIILALVQLSMKTALNTRFKRH